MKSVLAILSHALASVLIFLCQAEAATWHVSIEPLPHVPAAEQMRTISGAAAKVQAGDVVLVHSGVYRETVVVKASGTQARPIRFEAAPNANVTLTGADIQIAWRDEGGNVFSIDWPHRFIGWTKFDAHPDDERHRLIGRPEQVFADGYPLHQTLARETLSPGSFFVDFEARRLFVWNASGEPPAGAPGGHVNIEAATRATLFESNGAHVEVRGFRVRYAATHAQLGAVILNGRGNVLEDCIIERTSGVGAIFQGRDQVARRSRFEENGGLGFSAYRADNLLVTDCVVRNNHTKGFKRDWQAGGAKIVLSRNVTVEKSRILENRGPGLWFDIGDENCTVRNCLIADNEAAGIFYEISYGLRAHDNVIVGNGLAPDSAWWGAQAGISIYASPHCIVNRNLLVANKEGFSFREQRRTTPRIHRQGEEEESVSVLDATISQNVIADNRDVQTAGWFGTEDERHWPLALQESPGSGASDLSLEKLKIRMANNLYANSAGQRLFLWGPLFARHVVYRTLPEVQKALGLEEGSRVAPVKFRNYAARDFRLPADSLAFRMKCYPRGEVPGVSLGAIPSKP